MPHVTEHAPKVSTRSLYSYARESLRKRLHQDRHTDSHTDRQTERQTDWNTHTQRDRQTHRRVVQKHFPRRFEGGTAQIRSYLELFFLHDGQYFHWDGSNMPKANVSKVGHGPKMGHIEFYCACVSVIFTCIPLVFHSPHIKSMGHGIIGLLQARF